MRQGPYGMDMYDNDLDEFLNEVECTEKLNEQAAEIELLKIMLRREKADFSNQVQASTGKRRVDLLKTMIEVERLEQAVEELKRENERLRSLVIATEEELFPKKKECRRLKRENEKLREAFK
jgi:hypothetical protein